MQPLDLLLLAVAGVASGWINVIAGGGSPAWYLGVRAPLTVLIEVAFLVVLAAGMNG